VETAIEAAGEAGKLLRKNFGSTLKVNLATHHDIKLEIDEQAQAVITGSFSRIFPDHCISAKKRSREIPTRTCAGWSILSMGR